MARMAALYPHNLALSSTTGVEGIEKVAQLLLWRYKSLIFKLLKDILKPCSSEICGYGVVVTFWLNFECMLLIRDIALIVR